MCDLDAHKAKVDYVHAEKFAEYGKGFWWGDALDSTG